MSKTEPAALSQFLDYLKPHRTEAALRLRSNALCLLSLTILTYILPIPSLLSALRHVLFPRATSSVDSSWLRSLFCKIELVLAALFSLNILHAVYSIQYPRKPYEPLTSPAKKRSQQLPPSPLSKRMSILGSPSQHKTSSPFPKSPLSSSISANSMSTSGAGFGSSSQILGGSSRYPTTPQSSPSRTLHYTTMNSFSPNSSLNASATSTPSPSPVINAYRGKHSGDGLGRSLDGSFISRLRAVDTDD